MTLKIDEKCISLLNKIQDLALRGNGIGAFHAVYEFSEHFKKNLKNEELASEDEQKETN